MNIFCTNYNLKNLVKEPTCFKNIDKSSCVDLILTNKPSYFQTTTAVETGISDFHKFTLTIIKSTLHKLKPKIFHYRNYKTFDNKTFRIDLLFEISKKGFQNINSAEFEHLFLMTLNKHAYIIYARILKKSTGQRTIPRYFTDRSIKRLLIVFPTNYL